MDNSKKIGRYQKEKQNLSAHEIEPLKPEEKKMTTEVKKADKISDELMQIIISPEGNVEEFKKNFINYIEAQRVINDFLEVCKYDGPKITDIKLAILYADGTCGERNGTKAYDKQIAFILKEDPTILADFENRLAVIQKNIETNSINAQKMRAVGEYDAADALVAENVKLMEETNALIGIEAYTNIIHPIDATHTAVDTKSVYSNKKNDIEIIPEEIVEEKEEKTKEQLDAEIIESYFFEKGLKNVIIHGEKKSLVGCDDGPYKGAPYDAFISKFDFDNDSSLQIMDHLGVKYAKGAACHWVDPKEKLQHDEDGKAFYLIGKEKLYLEPGTLIIDVGNTYGVSIVDKGIIQMDHHGENYHGETSATRLLVDSLKNMPRFTKEREGEIPVWLDRYADFVTKMDNLSFEVNPDTWQEKWPNTLYAAQPFLFSRNRAILFEFFKKYPNISFDGFNKEELENIVGYKEYTSLNDSHQGLINRRILPKIPQNPNPDFIYEPVLVKDVVKQQEFATRKSVAYIKEKETEMIHSGLSTNSNILGRIVFDEKENDIKRNFFGATTAYGLGFDTYMIHNRDTNNVFISTRLLAKPLFDELKLRFNEPVLVRDHMLIIRDEELLGVNPDIVRELLIESTQIDGFSLEKLNAGIKELRLKIGQMQTERLNN